MSDTEELATASTRTTPVAGLPARPRTVRLAMRLPVAFMVLLTVLLMTGLAGAVAGTPAAASGDPASGHASAAAAGRVATVVTARPSAAIAAAAMAATWRDAMAATPTRASVPPNVTATAAGPAAGSRPAPPAAGNSRPAQPSAPPPNPPPIPAPGPPTNPGPEGDVATPSSGQPAVQPPSDQSGTTTGQGPGPGAPGGSAGSTAEHRDWGSTAGPRDWIADKITEAVDWLSRKLVVSALDPLLAVVGQTVLVMPDPTKMPGLVDLWGTTRSMALSLYVLLAMVAGLVVMSFETLQTRHTLKEVLPRVVIGLVAVNASLWVVGQASQLSTGMSQAILGAAVDPAAETAAMRQMLNGVVDGQADPGLWAIFVAIAVLVCLVSLVAGYVVRLALLAPLIVAGPLALACHALPHTEHIAKWWWRALGVLLAAQFAQALAMAVALKVFFAPGTYTTGTTDSDMKLFVALGVTVVLVKLPFWVLNAARFTQGRSLVGSLVKSFLMIKTLGLLKGGAGRTAAAMRAPRRPGGGTRPGGATGGGHGGGRSGPRRRLGPPPGPTGGGPSGGPKGGGPRGGPRIGPRTGPKVGPPRTRPPGPRRSGGARTAGYRDTDQRVRHTRMTPTPAPESTTPNRPGPAPGPAPTTVPRPPGATRRPGPHHTRPGGPTRPPTQPTTRATTRATSAGTTRPPRRTPRPRPSSPMRDPGPAGHRPAGAPRRYPPPATPPAVPPAAPAGSSRPVGAGRPGIRRPTSGPGHGIGHGLRRPARRQPTTHTPPGPDGPSSTGPQRSSRTRPNDRPDSD